MHPKTDIQRYPAYKDSGVEWIGEVPEHWGMKKLKHLFIEKKHTRNPELSCGSISFGKVVFKDDEKVPHSTKLSYQVVSKGDFLVNPLNLNYDLISLRIALSDIDVVVSAGYIVLRNSIKLEKKYFKWLLHRFDVAYMKLLGAGVRQTINYSDIGNCELILPPLPEQTRIAAFLDRKTAQIDQAIAQKERMIELLKERRQILIQNAVTRGLNPDVKMKDSGVDWIGEVPEGWEVKRLKFSFKLVGGGTPNKERIDFWDGEIPWVSPKDMKSDFIYSTEDNITEKGLRNSTTSLVESDSLLMVVRSGILQRTIPVGISKRTVSINQDMKAFVPIGDVQSNYLFHFVKGNDQFLKNDWVKQGATVESVEVELLKNGLIPIPPKSEQIAISKHVEMLSAKISTAIAAKQSEIEKLREYKVTLINSAVTGKIKVP